MARITLPVVLAAAGLTACTGGNSYPVLDAGDTSLVGKSDDRLVVLAELPLPDYATDATSVRVFPNDLVNVDVFEVDSLDRTVRVGQNGRVTLPLIGDVTMGGRTVNEIEDDLKARYGADYLQSPEISVFVKHSEARVVTLDGAFERPGVARISERSTLLRGVAQGGGLLKVADETKVFLFRPRGDVMQVAQYDVAAIRAAKRSDPALFPGDKIVAFRSRSKVAFETLKQSLGVASSAARVAAVPL